MKIAFISHACVSQTHQEKFERLARYTDVELFLIVPHWWEEGAKKIVFKKRGKLNFNIIPLSTLFTGKQFIHFYLNLAAHLKRINPDIIHVEEEPNSAVCFQTLWLKNRLKLKAKVVLFTWQNMFQRWKFPNPRFFFYPFFEKYSLRNVDYVIAGNKEGREILLKKGFSGEITVFPQFGINPDKFKKMDVSNLKQRLKLNKFVIGYLGRLLKMKGLYTLLNVVSKLRDCQLLIIGDGPEKNLLKNAAKKLGINERIIFIDSISHREVPVYLNCMDVLVLPSERTSNWKEQFGRVLVEAMACEVPVVGSSCGEIPNVIGDAGLVFEEANICHLKNKLQIVIKDKRMSERLGRRGRNRVLSKYTNNKIVENTYQVYCQLLKEKIKPCCSKPHKHKGLLISKITFLLSPSARFTKKFLSKKGKVLDLGCGGGNTFYTTVGPVAGVDLSLTSLSKTKDIYDLVVQADALKLPFGDGVFDYVVSQDFIGHIPEEKKEVLISEIYRVLKKGGRTIHYIETKGRNVIERFAATYPDLYQRYFIEQDGHYGLELPSRAIERFRGKGFKPIAGRKWASTFLRFPKEYLKRFDNEYVKKSIFLAIIVKGCKFIRKVKILERFVEILVLIVGWFIEKISSFDDASGIYVCYQKV